MGDIVSFNPKHRESPSSEAQTRAAIDPLLDEIAKVHNIDRRILDHFGDAVMVCGKEMMKSINCQITFRTFPQMNQAQRDEISNALQEIHDEKAMHDFAALVFNLPQLVRSLWGLPEQRA